MKWPKKIRAVYAKLWSGEVERAIAKAPRGGGKSKLLGTLGFDKWYFQDRSVVNMGGSLVQSQIVYNYFRDYIDLNDAIRANVDGDPKMHETIALTGNYFSCITASPKQARGKHPDIFLSDETCETESEVLLAALPMINTSENPLVVMASTFHKIFGLFQETWDNAEQLGYARFQWDIFDVVRSFDPAIWDRADIRAIDGIQTPRAMAAGRVGDPEGWIRIENVIQAWREKPTIDWFEVEYMGSRPSAQGLVLKPEDVDRARIADAEVGRYDIVKVETPTRTYFRPKVKDVERVLGIDWGFSSMTAVEDLMRWKDGVVIQLDSRDYTQVDSETIIDEIVEIVKESKEAIRFIYADSAGKFENIALQNALNKANLSCTVIEVVFSKEKFGTPGEEGATSLLGNYRAYFERGKIKTPALFKTAYWQRKRYRYQEGTDKPVKKDDHHPDAEMCALKHWRLGTFTRRLTDIKDDEDNTITGGLLDERF